MSIWSVPNVLISKNALVVLLEKSILSCLTNFQDLFEFGASFPKSSMGENSKISCKSGFFPSAFFFKADNYISVTVLNMHSARLKWKTEK